MLHTEPSFSIYANEDGSLDNKKRDLEVKKDSEFTFPDGIHEKRTENENLGIEQNEPLVPILNLDKGVEIDGDGKGVLEYYKRMINEDPFNASVLKNYAHFLQLNGDITGAEEHYFRATQADPRDGEILMQYAKFLWEIHHDQNRALSYFERASLAAPQDSDVLAAYASFLWEIDEDDENKEGTALQVEESLENGIGDNVLDMGEYYEKMLLQNPCDSLLLKNYAHFLQETKGDLEGAEEYYSRALVVDPKDGDVTSQYAQLVWELHGDKTKASILFERAIEAAPADSRVLGAYAKFLWEAEDEDEPVGSQ